MATKDQQTTEEKDEKASKASDTSKTNDSEKKQPATSQTAAKPTSIKSDVKAVLDGVRFSKYGSDRPLAYSFTDNRQNVEVKFRSIGEANTVKEVLEEKGFLVNETSVLHQYVIKKK